jgi:hypothetical protein
LLYVTLGNSRHSSKDRPDHCHSVHEPVHELGGDETLRPLTWSR